MEAEKQGEKQASVGIWGGLDYSNPEALSMSLRLWERVSQKAWCSPESQRAEVSQLCYFLAL